MPRIFCTLLKTTKRLTLGIGPKVSIMGFCMLITDQLEHLVATTWHSVCACFSDTSFISDVTLQQLGTCAMKPREAMGVVDPRLNVYGVRNLKVAGASRRNES